MPSGKSPISCLLVLLVTFVFNAVLCPVQVPGQTTDNNSERPNVLLIMTDDQGYGDFGVMGNDVMDTPNMDELARESASLDSFYVSPVCSPTRASLMTGRYSQRTGVVDTFLGRSMMRPSEVTVAEVLSQAGYRTAIFGKWHLGDNYPLRAMDQGFDRSLVIKGGGIAQPAEPLGNWRSYTDPLLFRNGRKVATEGYAMDVYTDQAIKFIRSSHANNEPFFVYHATNTPHGPFEDVPDKLYKKYLDKKEQLAGLMKRDLEGKKREKALDKLARISAMITNIDQNVGRLMDELDRLGIAKNTLVMFLVDNGPQTRRFVGPFRGKKGEVYEGGIRSPLWMRWPAELDSDMSSDRVTAHIDVMPTILDACGVPEPSDVELDGRSTLPLLRKDDPNWPERSVVIQSHRGDRPQRFHNFMIRRGPWKLLHASGFGRPRFEGDPKFELYHIPNDPDESENKIEDRPEIANQLKEQYKRWFNDVSSTRPDNYSPVRMVVGTHHENPSILSWQDWHDGGWMPHSNGHWLLRVAHTDRYDVGLILKRPAKAKRRVVLEVGGQKRTKQIGKGADHLLFRSIPLTKGPAKLKASIELEDGTRGAHQIVVRRR